MLAKSTSTDVTAVEADAVVVGIYSDGEASNRLTPSAARADAAAGGVITELLARQEIAGKANELTTLHRLPGVAAPLVLVVGLGEHERLDCGAAFQAAGSAARHLAGKARDRVAFYLGEDWTGELCKSGVAGAWVGCHGQDLYRAERKRHSFGELLWSGDEAAIASGTILGQSINLARRLVNEPPQEIYPESFAARASDVATECGLEIEIWDQERLERERAGSLLAVARGSRPPRLVILRYRGGPPGERPLAFVGKGVTFDSGGLSLKPTDSMKTMKGDMAGAAAVLAAMRAIALLQVPVNVVGLMGLSENMPSGSAMKLGDVLTARNGRTIEVLNTDAEGRLVLADVLDVAVSEKPSAIVDLATLTGSCVVALGQDVAGLMTNNQDWCDRVVSAARKCGELVWQLPMYSEYDDAIKSDVADIRNVGDGRNAGAIAGAKFLQQFVADVPWAHIDIAGPAFLDKSKPWIDGGGSGCFVRTLVELASVSPPYQGGVGGSRS